MQTADAGYLITDPLFARRKMQEVCQALLRAGLPRTKAGVRHVLSVPTVRALAVNPALVTLAESFIGKNAFPFRATLFDKSAMSNWLVAWHQDTAFRWRIALMTRRGARGLPKVASCTQSLLRLPSQQWLPFVSISMTRRRPTDRYESSRARTRTAYFLTMRFKEWLKALFLLRVWPGRAQSLRCGRWSYTLRLKPMTINHDAFFILSTRLLFTLVHV